MFQICQANFLHKYFVFYISKDQRKIITKSEYSKNAKETFHFKSPFWNWVIEATALHFGCVDGLMVSSKKRQTHLTMAMAAVNRNSSAITSLVKIDAW